jgi:predicted RNA methylase
MYQIIPQQIPHDRRAEINEKILFCIDTGKNELPLETIYNCYTGIGGLHNLRQADYVNYHEYSQAKKEFEMGQFFTPHDICRDMVGLIKPGGSEMILDMCCGMGNFFNHLPNPHNVYGFDIDGKAVSVARYLYPDSHIEKCDIVQYKPDKRFDLVIGNPPFNLQIDRELSQFYYMRKAYSVLNPAGILMIIVPSSFLKSEFWEKARVTAINRDFSFIGQTKLNPNVFASVGVHNFDTKIMVFMCESRHFEITSYNADEFISWEELGIRIEEAKKLKSTQRFSD